MARIQNQDDVTPKSVEANIVSNTLQDVSSTFTKKNSDLSENKLVSLLKDVSGFNLAKDIFSSTKETISNLGNDTKEIGQGLKTEITDIKDNIANKFSGNKNKIEEMTPVSINSSSNGLYAEIMNHADKSVPLEKLMGNIATNNPNEYKQVIENSGIVSNIAGNVANKGIEAAKINLDNVKATLTQQIDFTKVKPIPEISDGSKVVDLGVVYSARNSDEENKKSFSKLDFLKDGKIPEGFSKITINEENKPDTIKFVENKNTTKNTTEEFKLADININDEATPTLATNSNGNKNKI